MKKLFRRCALFLVFPRGRAWMKWNRPQLFNETPALSHA
jgi:hypothetical protein